MQQLRYFFSEYAAFGQERGVTTWLAYVPTKERVLHGRLEFSETTLAKIPKLKRLAKWQPTDLPEVIATKQQMISSQLPGDNLKGKLELVPLNAMDATAFKHVVNRFANGPITIVNEGLLMYLNEEEKKQLCQTIHQILEERGGCWITADVYIKRTLEMQQAVPQTRGEAAFFEQHNIEENKFDSYQAAEIFFKEQGFEIVKEATPNFKELSVLPHLLNTMPPEFRNSKTPPPKIQATWMLKV
jgi:O-methyltransferase involved in polyketide biosynthesis